MLKKLILVLVILSCTTLVWGDVDEFVGISTVDEYCGISTIDEIGGQTVASGGESKWVGFPNSGGTPSAPVGSWSVFGGAADRTYGRLWTATEGGTVTHINMMGTTEDSWQDAWYVVYNGTTLIGTGTITEWSPTDDWNGEVSISVEGGQSLSFSTDDVLRFGIAWDDDVAANPRVNRDGGASDGGIEYDSTNAVEGAPNATASWTTSGSAGLGAIMRYTSD